MNEEKVAAEIFAKALEAPLRQLADNAGVEGTVIVEKVKSTEFNIGYNAMTGEIEDMIAAGIVDPAKVVRSAVQNAASIAGMVLTTEALVVEKPEPEAPAALVVAVCLVWVVWVVWAVCLAWVAWA